jgi:hypothetical protein
MSDCNGARELQAWLWAQSKRPTREEMARRYAELLKRPLVVGQVRLLNEAIERRWSPSGLDYIKRRAWEIVYL